MDHEHIDRSPASQPAGQQTVRQCAQHEDPPAAPERAASPVCYHQNCPVCGRNLRIRVMLLGRRVYCQHCGGGFIATDVCDGTGGTRVADDRPRSSVVDELIERAAVMLGRSAGVGAGDDRTPDHGALSRGVE